MFQTYLQLGFDHISDPKAYDHIVFLVALCAAYRPEEWKKILILVTAFTIGHSLTLALAVLDVIRFPAKVIELLIPVTILITAIVNVLPQSREGSNSFKGINPSYPFALFFGLIHGMGFSNFLRSALMPGQEGDLVGQLFAFNLGIELGQLLIVVLIMGMAFIALRLLKVSPRAWNQFVSGAAAGISVSLLIGLL